MTAGRDLDMATGRRRLRLLGAMMVVALLGLAARLVDLAMWPGEARIATPAAAGALQGARRADIVDRNGVLLATDYPKTSVFADPAEVIDPETSAIELAAVLGGDPAAMLAKLSTKRRFVWLERHITDAEHRAVIRLGLPGIGFRTEPHRIYPQRELVAHLVGFVGSDNQGLAGIERSYEARLTAPETVDDSLVLTLDLGIQELVRTELQAAVARFAAKGGTGLVLDAATGAVLAMVSLPDFDPNHHTAASPEALFNRNTQGTYELGSPFKLFTVAMALDAGVVDMGDGYDATQPLVVGRHRIHDFHAKRRWLSVAEIIAFSSNIGAARMAQALGPEAQLAYLGRFGLLERHPMPLLEMASPQVPSPWRPINGITAAYGHGIAVTPLQTADALAGILCAGPIAHVVAEGAPRIRPAPPVSPTTAAKMRWLMWLTVAEGTGKLARVPGYLVGGKTGSADKSGPHGYDSGRLLSSFIGAFPIERPRYVVLVTLDEPQGDAETYGLAHGGWTAAPTVGRIISGIGPLLGLPPIAPDAEHWFRERLVESQAINGRTKRVEPSFWAVPGAPWVDDQGEPGCGCRPCSILS